jgi:hypothetical protein
VTKNELQNFQCVEVEKAYGQDVTNKSSENAPSVETLRYKLYSEALRVQCVEIL